jgi:hypothetical protein
MYEYLFSYGTLQKENIQLALFGRMVQGTRDVLSGYKVSEVDITDEAFLATGEQSRQLTATPSSNPNDSIQGTVLELTEAELQAADRYEPVIYKRIKVVLASGKAAWIYSVSESTL